MSSLGRVASPAGNLNEVIKRVLLCTNLPNFRTEYIKFNFINSHVVVNLLRSIVTNIEQPPTAPSKQTLESTYDISVNVIYLVFKIREVSTIQNLR